MLGVMEAVAGETQESGGASGGSSEGGGPSSIPGGGGVMDEIEKSSGGNRWPRPETIALLKIRSDMDAVFRDASLKGPLWEQVSKKMAELGFQRSAKKCKEKFENVFKYHKRTKDGRSSKPDGKSYRFFDQLEALENTPPNNNNPFTPPPPRPPAPTAAVPPPNLQIPSNITVPSSTSPTPISIIPPIPNIAPKITNNIVNPLLNSSLLQQSHQPQSQQQQQLQTNLNTPIFQPARPNMPTSLLSNSTSSSTSSDEDIQQRRRGRKRKWRDYFERLMKDVVRKQEELQNKFLDALEKRERDRIAREEAWRVQETARLNREHDLLVQERSMAAAKDTAVIAFLHKVTNQPNLQSAINSITNNNDEVPVPHQAPVQPENNPRPIPQSQPPAAAAPPPAPVVITPTKTLDHNHGDNMISASSSRWPKAEVEALIKLRTSLDIKYQENVPKGPLWEEISLAMAKIGYNRSSKRCKEKWENINKYYKKVKESNKRRPEDSKTCPYFHLLQEIYKERANVNTINHAGFDSVYGMKPEEAAPIMARPENQWPVHDVNNEAEDEDEDEEEDEDEDEGGEYEIIMNNNNNKQLPSSLTD